MKIYYLNDGLANATVHSSLSPEEVVSKVNEIARTKYPSGIKPNFKIISANEVKEGFFALDVYPLSDKKWWDLYKETKKFLEDI